MATRFSRFLLGCCLLLIVDETSAQIPVLDVPPGFRATLFAGDEQASNIQFLTTNAAGEIVVSGPGYIRVLVDSNGDGQADLVHPYADSPASGAQGLFVEGPHTYCIGDAGLLKYSDRDGDGRADGPPELIQSLRAGGEHFTHSIRRGPDGWWYLIAGNEAGIGTTSITSDRSPLTQPQAGVLARLPPDFSSLEVLADGYRNAYDFAFNAEGDLFTYDSDGEREISLPIYRPTRVFHTVTGMNHGWVSRSWKKPNYFPEMSPAIVELGRGSPTGVVVYRHHRFPPEFRNTLFVLDWTYGRIMAIKLKRQGASWLAQAKQFARGVGEYGFAPTAAAVGPDGALYVSVGGRGTQGGVFRIAYEADTSEPGSPWSDPRSPLKGDLADVLNAPQPLAAWSRARWVPWARQLGEEAFLVAALDSSRSTAARIRAIEILVELFQGPDIDFLRAMEAEPDRELRARTIWAYGRSVQGNPDRQVLRQALQDTSPVVVRQALEVLLGCDAAHLEGLEEAVARSLGSEDHVVRQLAVKVASRMTNESFRQIGEVARKTGWSEALQMARAFVDRGYVSHAYAWRDIGLAAIQRHDEPEVLLTATLLIQHALGGFGDSPVHAPVFDGYLARLPLPAEQESLQVLAEELEKLYPTGEAILDWELARLIAMISPTRPKLLEQLLARIQPESNPIDDLHHLICLACLPVERTAAQSERIAQALLNLFPKLESSQATIDRNWEPRVSEMYQKLVEYDPTLPGRLVDHELFGQADHVLFVRPLQGEIRQRAVQRFLARVEQGQLELTPALVSMLAGQTDDQSLLLARGCLADEVLAPTALLVLAEANRPEDREALQAGLLSPHWEVVTACLKTQRTWEPATPELLGQLVLLLERLAREQELASLGDDTLVEVRRRAEAFPEKQPLPPSASYKLSKTAEERRLIATAWQDWYAANFPDVPLVRANGSANSPWSEWEARFAEVDWSAGDAARGAISFQRRQCAQCHQGRSTVGPSLEGIAGRFSPRDLMIAIVDPNRDVSPRYRTTMLVTHTGKTHTGIIIYESSDGLLLRDSTHRTLRIESSDIDLRRQLSTSLMPENLLKEASLEEVADLFAYLKSLGGQ